MFLAQGMQRNPDSGILEIFACGIRNPGLWNPESKTPSFYTPLKHKCHTHQWEKFCHEIRNDTGQSEIALLALGRISLAEQRAKNKAKVVFKNIHGLHQKHYQKYLQKPKQSIVIVTLETQLKRLPFPYVYTQKRNGAKIWNDLPAEMRSSETLASFKAKIKSRRP